MNTRHSSMQRLRKVAVSGLLAALLLVGCGGEKPEAMLASAKQYLAKNDPKAATIQLKNALQQKPDLAEARFLLGKALLEAGDATGAEVELRKAQGYKYPADEVTPLLARSLLALGQADKVTSEMASAELSHGAGQGRPADFAGDGLPDAEQAGAGRGPLFAAAVAAQAGYPPALLGQARLKASHGDLPAAMALVDAAIATSPELYDAWQLKGDLLSNQGDAAAAMLAYRKDNGIASDLPAGACGGHPATPGGGQAR
jgi:tetratricopeptide (TPR) repeat protein